MKSIFTTSGRNALLLLVLFYTSDLFAQRPIPQMAGQTAAASSQGIRFIENKNQWDPNVHYKLELNDAAMFFEKNAVTYSLLSGADMELLKEAKMGGTNVSTPTGSQVKAHAFQLQFNNASPLVHISAEDVHPDYRNYYIGNKSEKWASEVYSYKRLSYSGIYRGVDLKFYASPNAETQESMMKYDFIVHAGSNPSPIQIEYKGLDNIYLKNGNLHLVTSVNTIIEQKPYAYQTINKQEVAVECRYKLNGHQLSFEFPSGYNNQYDLVIDPVLVFSTYTGSTSDNFGFTATYDLQSNLYAGGIVYGIGYPTTLGAFQVNFSSLVDVSITKFNPTGTNLIYSTYLGGTDTEIPSSLVVNSNNELVVLGATSSSDFPTSLTGYDRSFNGGIAVNFTQNGADFNFGTDIFVTKFNAAGTALGGSTFVGGTGNDGINQNSTALLQYNYGDQFRGEVIVDNQNNIYVASSSLSSNFPVTAGVFQPAFGGTQDAVVFKMNTTLSALTWSSYLGGNGVDAGYSLKLDGSNNLFVTGGTTSANLASTAGALNPNSLGAVDGYISKINNAGTLLSRTTYIGTNVYDQTYFVDLDRFDNVYVFGQTRGTYPVTGGVYSNANTKQFIHKLSNTLNTTLFSTTFGFGTTTTNISPTAFLVDVCGYIYASGWGGSVNTGWNSITGTTAGMPTTVGAFQTTTDGSDFYFIVLGPDAGFLDYATFFGGNGSQEHVDGGTSRFDKRGAIYQAVCAGCGANSLFPTTPGVWSNTNNSNNCNLGAIKYDFQISAVNVDVQPSPSAQGCAPFTVNFSDIGVNSSSWLWTFGDGGTSTLENPSHTFINPGTYQVRLIGYDSTSCNGVVLTDTAFTTIIVRAAFTTNVNASICQGERYFAGGAFRTTPGTYRDTLIATGGCDSIIITALSVRPNSATQVNASICQGESYFAEGGFRTTPGTYRDTLTSANGCDSVITTILTVRPNSATQVNASICQGQSYFAAGGFRTTPGTYSDTLTSANGCDSVITTILTVRPNSATQVNASICQGESYFAGGGFRTTPGTYRDTVPSANGCDSVITTILTVRPNSATQVNASICQGESYFAGGSLRTTPGTYRDTLTSANGCDSVITTVLAVRPNSATQANASICDGESYFAGGAFQTTAGTYRDTVPSSNGCDSVITTILTIRTQIFTTVNASICDGESYLAGGGLQTVAGTYRDTLVSANGCDSIVTTILSVRLHSFTTVNVSICDGESYLAGGGLQTTAGTYRDTLPSANGCDSVITTILSVRLHSFTTVNASICDGESYLAGGGLQTTAGTYRDTLPSANGCDSVITTILSVRPHSFTTVNASICDGESYLAGGGLQTTAGTYLDTLLSANGCDSIITTNLTIRPHSFTTVNANICVGDSYLAGGALQTTAGVYRDTLPSANGCDSVITTNLTILPVYATIIDTTICREEPFNGVYYDNDTTLIDSLLTISGCDSIIYTNIFPEICCPAPVLTCNTTVITENQIFCGDFVLTPPSVFSLCNVVSLTSDYPGGPFPIGITIVTWIAIDQYGQADTCQQSVIYNPVSLLSSYTLLGFEEVELMPTNDVRHGAVGVMNAGGEAYLQNHTMVTGNGSFVAAPVITTFPNTQVSNPINTTANVTLPVFEVNPTTGGMDITVATNGSITLTDTVYGRISLFRGATVTFDNPYGIVNVQEIRVNNKAAGAYTTLIFKQCTKVRVKHRVDLGPKCTINPDSLNVIFYVEAANTSDQENQPAADIGPRAVVNADFYVPNGRFYAHPGTNVDPARYTGTFIARWITGDPDIVWTKRNDCDTSYSCQPGGQLRMAYQNSEEGNAYRMDVIPNPFSNQAVIQFATKNENERVSLSVMNTTGQLINVLFDGVVESGRNVQVSFDGSKLPTGIYYALLRTADGVYSTKLVVTR